MRKQKSKAVKTARKTIALTSVIAVVVLAFYCYGVAIESYAKRSVSCDTKIVAVNKVWSSQEIEREIRIQSALYDLDGDKMVAIAKCESGLNPNAMNKKSTATGLFQIINGTWKHYKCTGGITNPQDNIKCAMKLATLSGLDEWKECNKKTN